MGTTAKSVNDKLRGISSFKDKLKEIQKYLEEASENVSTKDEFGYIVPSLQKLIEMMDECEQYDLTLPEGVNSVFTTRVFKCDRYIPDYILSMFNVRQTKIGGLFLELPCWILSAEQVDLASDNRYKVIESPETYGLPSNNQANYATLKSITPDCYIVLAKLEGFNITRDWIYTSRQIEYIYTT